MQSIGDQLEEARKQRGITVREASEATKIRGEYLNNFESNSFDINLPDIYIRGFLRSYANYLKINADKILTDYNAHLLGESKPARRENRELLGRLELQQQPLHAEETISAGAIDDEEIEKAAEPEESIPIWERLNLEKDVAIKIGIAGGLAVLLIIAIIWGFLAFMGSDEPATDSDLAETPTPAQAARDATPFTLIANDDVRVEVKQIDGDLPLFFAVLPRGQEQELSAVGSIRVTYSDAEALSIRIGSKTYAMPPDRSSMRTTPSKVLADQASSN
ncbi:MAG TPA: hypothetical protein DIV79_08440 [Opitutae bacterium]|nr:hypothetical protein [Opitutaceae bacterium]HCR30029.1 hypothetical protein [Opitutae bacterium]